VVVLVIEDNERNLRLVRDVLTYAGLESVGVRTAEEGLVLARELQPEVILLDIQLPGMDGFAALAELRKDARTRSIPVAAVTAFAMANDRERVSEAGFDAHLAKPIDVSRLPEQVRDLASGGHPVS
jgi:two-component system, cell cycle response regulator DivK